MGAEEDWEENQTQASSTPSTGEDTSKRQRRVTAQVPGEFRGAAGKWKNTAPWHAPRQPPDRPRGGQRHQQGQQRHLGPALLRGQQHGQRVATVSFLLAGWQPETMKDISSSCRQRGVRGLRLPLPAGRPCPAAPHPQPPLRPLHRLSPHIPGHCSACFGPLSSSVITIPPPSPFCFSPLLKTWKDDLQEQRRLLCPHCHNNSLAGAWNHISLE